jgi:hypothetical protein
LGEWGGRCEGESESEQEWFDGGSFHGVPEGLGGGVFLRVAVLVRLVEISVCEGDPSISVYSEAVATLKLTEIVRNSAVVSATPVT